MKQGMEVTSWGGGGGLCRTLVFGTTGRGGPKRDAPTLTLHLNEHTYQTTQKAVV